MGSLGPCKPSLLAVQSHLPTGTPAVAQRLAARLPVTGRRLKNRLESGHHGSQFQIERANREPGANVQARQTFTEFVLASNNTSLPAGAEHRRMNQQLPKVLDSSFSLPVLRILFFFLPNGRQTSSQRPRPFLWFRTTPICPQSNAQRPASPMHRGGKKQQTKGGAPAAAWASSRSVTASKATNHYPLAHCPVVLCLCLPSKGRGWSLLESD